MRLTSRAQEAWQNAVLGDTDRRSNTWCAVAPVLLTSARLALGPAMSLDAIAARGQAFAQHVISDPRGAFYVLRWFMVALLLLLALAVPVPGWAGLPSWVFVLVYAGFGLIGELLERHWDWPRFSALLAALDVLLAALLYVLGQDEDGPLYALFILAVLTAAATLPPRWTLFLVATVVLANIAAELTVRQVDPPNEILADAATRTIADVFVAVGAVVAVRLMRLQQEATWRAQSEAEKLAEFDRLRRTFVSETSHDLQTPLTSIRAGMGLLETSASGRLRGDELQLLKNVRRNVDRLGLQINDLLSFNQIQAEQFQIKVAPFDLRVVIANAVAIMQPLVEQKGQTLHVAIDQPLMVVGDQRHLEHAIVNLVANAHRHTSAATRIAIAGQETADGVLLQVEDDGPGIPDHAKARIFERFYRLDLSVSGSGLGLTIVQTVVEHHGGRIWFESKSGHGTSFFVLLPRHTDQT
jgi:signal transduction histidine kinase